MERDNSLRPDGVTRIEYRTHYDSNEYDGRNPYPEFEGGEPMTIHHFNQKNSRSKNREGMYTSDVVKNKVLAAFHASIYHVSPLLPLIVERLYSLMDAIDADDIEELPFFANFRDKLCCPLEELGEDKDYEVLLKGITEGVDEYFKYLMDEDLGESKTRKGMYAVFAEGSLDRKMQDVVYLLTRGTSNRDKLIRLIFREFLETSEQKEEDIEEASPVNSIARRFTHTPLAIKFITKSRVHEAGHDFEPDSDKWMSLKEVAAKRISDILDTLAYSIADLAERGRTEEALTILADLQECRFGTFVDDPENKDLFFSLRMKDLKKLDSTKMRLPLGDLVKEELVTLDSSNYAKIIRKGLKGFEDFHFMDLDADAIVESFRITAYLVSLNRRTVFNRPDEAPYDQIRRVLDENQTNRLSDFIREKLNQPKTWSGYKRVKRAGAKTQK